MNAEKINEMALAEAVYSILSSNDGDLTPDQILQAWKENQEADGVTICEAYDGYDFDYLAQECESMRDQFIRFAREVLQEVGK